MESLCRSYLFSSPALRVSSTRLLIVRNVRVVTPRGGNIMNGSAKRGLLISKGWIQAIAIVVLVGFLILGMLAYRTYTDEPPIPSQVMHPDGQLLFAGADVIA